MTELSWPTRASSSVRSSSPAIAPAFRSRTRSGGASGDCRRARPLGQRAGRGGRRRARRGQPVVGAQGLRARDASRRKPRRRAAGVSRARSRSGRARRPLGRGSRLRPRGRRRTRRPAAALAPSRRRAPAVRREPPRRLEDRPGGSSGGRGGFAGFAFSAAASSAAAFSLRPSAPSPQPPFGGLLRLRLLSAARLLRRRPPGPRLGDPLSRSCSALPVLRFPPHADRGTARP